MIRRLAYTLPWTARLFLVVLSFVALALTHTALAQTVVGTSISTTTLRISICGDSLVNAGEECDVPGDTGQYSTTIAGRQCTDQCLWAPYCGDGILQTLFSEECDDGNNDDGDFCSAICEVEPAGSGGGHVGGGGSSGGGGSDTRLGDTQVSIVGKAYPNVSVTILVDGDVVGTVRTNSSADFSFNTDTKPGTASLSFWATDSKGTRSLTISTTFDVTQGAVTNVNGIFVPPTIRTSNANPNPGETITLSGQTIPNATVEVLVDSGAKRLTATANASGEWSVPFDTGTVSASTHTVKARFTTVNGALRTESQYGTALSIFVGVEGKPTSSADLNRDGKVNLTDFSILVFWWGTPGGNSNPPADINGNGRVSLEDFSILLFNWTG